MRIGDVLRAKPSHEVVTISPDATVRELIALLAEHNVGALDRQRRRHRRSTASSASATSSAASTRTATVLDDTVGGDHDRRRARPATEDTRVDDLMKMMTEHRVRHVPVVADGRLAASSASATWSSTGSTSCEFERDQLDNYVHQT